MGSVGNGIGWTWDPLWDRCDLPWDSFWERTDRGLNGHGILSRIAVTFRMVPSGNKRTRGSNGRGIPSGIERTFRIHLFVEG